jgi:hypothetical protein
MVDFIYAALPLRPLRALLIRVHMESCPHCQSRLLSRPEAGKLFVASDQIGNTEGLWRRISAQSGSRTPVPEASPAPAGAGWRWATAVSTAAVVAVTGFWLLRQVERPGFRPGDVGPADRFQIDYVNVGGAPAQTFVYQPQGTDTVFIWATKNP